jgi:tetraacyldisaccharide 4'-kinase
MRLFRFVLFPFSVLYGWVMALRNVLYDQRLLSSHSFAVPVIGVGNLTVGGTGKTPHVEYLLRLLASRERATLSRGYGRKTKGFLLADAGASSATIGDEPFQYYADFPGVRVAVCEDRVKGIRALLGKYPATEVILLDDAFQHRPVRPQVSVLITDYGRLFYRDFVLPAGLLREHRSGARRADAIIVSKCDPKLREDEMDRITLKIRQYGREEVPVFFSWYRYGKAVSFGSAGTCQRKVILVTGIANPGPLKEYLVGAGHLVVQHLVYPDHHLFTAADLAAVRKAVAAQQGEPVSVVTTRKDAVRLLEPALREVSRELPFFYIPVQVAFLRHQEQFDTLIKSRVEAVALPQNP